MVIMFVTEAEAMVVAHHGTTECGMSMPIPSG